MTWSTYLDCYIGFFAETMLSHSKSHKWDLLKPYLIVHKKFIILAQELFPSFQSASRFSDREVRGNFNKKQLINRGTISNSVLIYVMKGI
jgi:hypothetical protein